MPRTHTDAVMVYSGTPTRRPLRSSGLLIPEAVFTKMQRCRNMREGNTGMAMNGWWPRDASTW